MFTVENLKTAKEFSIDNGKLTPKAYVNKITNRRIDISGSEFVISYGKKQSLFYKNLRAEELSCRIVDKETFQFHGEVNGIKWTVIERITLDDDVIKKTLEISASEDIFLDYVDLETFSFDDSLFNWTIPTDVKRIYVPSYIATLGQPVYVDSMFFAAEFPTADNRIDKKGFVTAKYYVGRRLSECGDGNVYKSVPYVAGAAIGNRFDMIKSSFFKYISRTSRNPRFRLQFNSWYDHMLDIDSEKIEKEFRAVHEGLTKNGLRPLDCYVVDDGWVDYKKSEFWAFRDDRFPNKFEKESLLTKELDSTFGVWFGPRGGYTEAFSYAKNLEKIGYSVCKRSMDICTGDPKYIRDLGKKMEEFVKEYNVTYFKIDGFAVTPCRNKRHGHPVGGYKDMYFYTFLWEEWLKAFDSIHAVDDSVFLNVTSYSHCSPFFMRWADAIWINNAGDMAYEGDGSNLDQCLNYRDGRYHDFAKVRQLQFPVAYIYNHEPCYGKKNYNPPLPNKSHKTVTYTDAEFAKYLLGCMMRGSGFVELYFSPEMFDGKKWEIAAKVLTWAEENFDIIKNANYFGGIPKDGDVYGYYAANGDDVIFSLRNPSAVKKSYVLDNREHCFRDDAFTACEIYPTIGEEKSFKKGETMKISLEPREMKIIRLKFLSK